MRRQIILARQLPKTSICISHPSSLEVVIDLSEKMMTDAGIPAPVTVICLWKCTNRNVMALFQTTCPVYFWRTPRLHCIATDLSGSGTCVFLFRLLIVSLWKWTISFAFPLVWSKAVSYDSEAWRICTAGTEVRSASLAATMVWQEFENLYNTPECQSRQTWKSWWVISYICYFVLYKFLSIFKRTLCSRGQWTGVWTRCHAI